MNEGKGTGNPPQQIRYKTTKSKNNGEALAVAEFKVHGEDGLLGTIEIGHGTIGWKAASEGSFQAARLGLIFKMNGLQ